MDTPTRHISCYAKADTALGQRLRHLPGAALDLLPVESMPEGVTPSLPYLAVIDLSLPGAHSLTWHLVKKKTPVVIANCPGPNGLYNLAKTAARNRVPAVMLGSWRYIPAVATLKELASGLFLGKNLTLEYATRAPLTAWTATLLADLSQWLTVQPYRACKLRMPEECEVPALSLTSPEREIRLRLTGETGFAEVDFTLDGQDASCTVQILNHCHERIIPPGNPAVSELAVLAYSLMETHPRLHELPLLMSFPW